MKQSSPVELYGPNHEQVAEFARLTGGFAPAEWQGVVAQRGACEAAYGRFDLQEFESLVRIAGLRRWEQAEESARLVVRERLPGGAEERLEEASAAIGALSACDLLSPEQFAAAYAPFARVLPVESLGPGSAPVVSPPPEDLKQRFVLRLRALTEPEWGQVAMLADTRDAAFTPDAVGAALDRAGRLLQDGIIEAGGSDSADWLDDLDEFFGAGGPFGGSKEIWGLLGDFLGRTEYWSASQYADRLAGQEDSARRSARQALFAVALVDVEDFSDQDFATLYLPFAGLIPPATLRD